MKVVVACGGTGGHAFPGLAVAEELKRRGHDVTVWDSGRDIESSVMRFWRGNVFSTGSKQLSGRNALSILRSILRCRREMRRERPDVLLAMGSYSSLPPVLAARSCKVPVVLHEANTVPGRAVEFLSRFAKKVAVSFEVTARHLPSCATERTGLPVRAEIASGTRFDFIPKDAFVVFVTGGSQGAHMVNCLASEALVLLKRALDARGSAARPLYVIHQTGAADEGAVMATYAHVSLPSRVCAFEREMANAFASADLVIARAGASTCFELAACGKPALLIPLPSAMRDHQHFNADAFVAQGAADEGIQSQLSPRQLCLYLQNRYDRPETLAAMSAKMRALATPDAAARVADLVERKGA
ncbi:MAG: UDP-N-acetylglucosamine--N-acetylmuramyl-(pentapeptide) pyrophosphoryl-undecaprenol N-acetylglucosamine transferase [Kiritimatiellae bacterium]|nr:UDP-N-acetylglucosamine--N-acetylmuramyl-(pentapeptide) pyrophosphoryl-undecaprenol N-acetylglucosamine transferase [Kiritimatiellia bacterium]